MFGLSGNTRHSLITAVSTTWNRVIYAQIGDDTFAEVAEIIDNNFLEHLY